MLTNVVKAVRAHYAALQHRPSPDRTPLDYSVGYSGNLLLTAGTVFVKAKSKGSRQREMTRLTNRLISMYPEATNFDVAYRD